MGHAAIVGIGHSRFGRAPDKQLHELAWQAIRQALQDAGVTQRDIQFLVVGNAGGWSSELLPAVVVGEYAGLTPVGSMRVEAACASGSAALRAAATAVESGKADIALAVGVEKMTESTTMQIVEMIGRAGSFFWEFEHFGLTFPGYYAMYATAYMHEYRAKEEDLAAVAVKNHYYASLNPYAHFQKQITIEDVMKSRYVAWPLKLYDCSPQTDGAAAVVVASEEMAKKLTDTPIWIRAQGVATGTANLSKRDNFLSLEPAVLAAEQAYKQVGIERSQSYKYFDVAEVHDCFTIAEIIAYEDLGFVERGQGYALAREGETYKGGRIPVNLDGGLKAKGHPIAATGVSMAVELTKQLRQQNPESRQADIKKGLAVAHNIGGTGHYAYVTIFSLNKDVRFT
ncbi:MAG TPA: thiolase domain-containing protein [Candidatus Caldiarchaeum subterraneum]|uniref:Thiolase domain-containing protein n=1 Tax=Caldiarchaeum subterraneum TaxID=311458 RepID=A0A832ZV81_CALS0|nr:thiolase domain-containing protein [Candidatus Caldarchaeum subterraneum]